MRLLPSSRPVAVASVVCFLLAVVGGGLVWKGAADGPGVYIVFGLVFLVYVALRFADDVWPAMRHLRVPVSICEGVVLSKEASDEGYRLRFDFSTEVFTVGRETYDAVAAGERARVAYRPGTGRVEEVIPCPGEEPGST